MEVSPTALGEELRRSSARVTHVSASYRRFTIKLLQGAFRVGCRCRVADIERFSDCCCSAEDRADCDHDVVGLGA